MLNFIIDIFCKDTIIGLSNFEETKSGKTTEKKEEQPMRLYKNFYPSLFKNEDNKGVKFKDSFY